MHVSDMNILLKKHPISLSLSLKINKSTYGLSFRTDGAAVFYVGKMAHHHHAGHGHEPLNLNIVSSLPCSFMLPDIDITSLTLLCEVGVLLIRSTLI